MIDVGCIYLGKFMIDMLDMFKGIDCGVIV